MCYIILKYFWSITFVTESPNWTDSQELQSDIEIREFSVRDVIVIKGLADYGTRTSGQTDHNISVRLSYIK